MSFLTSFAGKIIIPVIFVAAGLGFIFWSQPDDTNLSNQTSVQPMASVPEAIGFPEQSPASTPQENLSPSVVPSPSVRISEQQQKKNAAATITPVAPSSTPTPSPRPSAPVETEQFKYNPAWADAVVNLFCSERNSQSGAFASGSGVIIDPRGIILTNAHVGVDFLFADWPTPSVYNCVVRTGSPAMGQYRAALLYIPDAWVNNNVADVKRSNIHIPYENKDFPIGKKDYALLYITAPSTSDSYAVLPSSHSFLESYTGPIASEGTPMYMIGYPASFLGSQTAQRYLHKIASPTSVYAQRTFEGSNGYDILAFEGVVAGQHGSSGGAVVQAGGKLAGVPTFFDDKGDWLDGQGVSTSDNIMNAITIEYISRDLKADTGYSLQEFIVRDTLAETSRTFLSGDGQRYRNMYVDAWKSLGIPVPGTY